MASKDPRVAASRAAVLGAVADLLGERGPAGVTVDAVLARSGVARATLYRHWPSRQALLTDGLRELMRPPGPAAPAGGGVEDRLRALVRNVARQFARERAALMMPVLLDASRRDPELAGLMRELDDARRRPLREIVARGVADGELAADTCTDVAHAQLIGPLVFRRLISGESLDQAFCDRLVSDFLRAHASSESDGPVLPAG